MKSKVSGVYSLILVLVAFSSLVTMFALTRIDNMIKQDLYSYGLRFSYAWAMPYWTLTSLVFVMGWINIIMACTFQFYVFLYGRKREEAKSQEKASKPETTPPSIEVQLIEAEEEEVKKPEPLRMKPSETVEAEIEETMALPMEVELGVQDEEEAQMPTEESGEAEPAAPQQSVVCQSCEGQNPVGTEFCEYCGVSLVPVVQMNCPECGAEVPSTMRFCANCGSLLEQEKIRPDS